MEVCWPRRYDVGMDFTQAAGASGALVGVMVGQGQVLNHILTKLEDRLFLKIII